LYPQILVVWEEDGVFQQPRDISNHGQHRGVQAFGEAPEEDPDLLLCDPQEEMFVFSLRQFGFAVCNGFVDLDGDHRFKKCPALLEKNVWVGVGFDKQLVGRLVVGVRNVVVEAEGPEVLTVSNAARRDFDVVGFQLFLADRSASRQDDEKPDEG